VEYDSRGEMAKYKHLYVVSSGCCLSNWLTSDRVIQKIKRVTYLHILKYSVCCEIVVLRFMQTITMPKERYYCISCKKDTAVSFRP